MERKVAAVYTVFSILAFIFFAVWTAYSFFQLKTNNFVNALTDFGSMKEGVSHTLQEQGTFEAAGFRSFVRSSFLENPSIDILTISSSAGEMQYVFARSVSDLQSPSVTDNQWSGSLRYNSVTQHLFSSFLPFSVARGEPPLRIQVVYTIIAGSDVYSIARTLLIGVMAFVILTGIVILILPFLRRRSESSGRIEGTNESVSESPRAPEGSAPLEAQPAPPENEHPPEQPLQPEEPVTQPVAQPAPEAKEQATEAAPSDEAAAQSIEPAPEPSEVVPDLPPGVELPSLNDVLGEDVSRTEQGEEIALFEELRGKSEGASTVHAPSPIVPQGGERSSSGAPLEVIEIEEPAEPLGAEETQGSTYHSAEDEMEDLEEIEDLEMIDGHHPQAHEERGKPATPGEGAPKVLETGTGETASTEPLELEELPPVELEEDTVEADPGTLPDGPRIDADDGTDTQGPPAPSGEGSRELFNPESGLAWQNHLQQRLSFELDRAASFDQDLAVCIMRFAAPQDKDTRLGYARMIRGNFPFHDLCFEYGSDGFAIVLPNTEIDQAIRTMEDFSAKAVRERGAAPSILMGLSARNGRLLGSERLLKEAETAVRKAREDGNNRIFALRVDPGKYREYIKSTLD